MKIKILSASREILNAEANEVVLPGEDGELTVMDFHQPCLSRLMSGRIRVQLWNKKERDRRKESFLITRGVASIGSHGISILVEEVTEARA